MHDTTIVFKEMSSQARTIGDEDFQKTRYTFSKITPAVTLRDTTRRAPYTNIFQSNLLGHVFPNFTTYTSSSRLANSKNHSVGSIESQRKVANEGRINGTVRNSRLFILRGVVPGLVEAIPGIGADDSASRIHGKSSECRGGTGVYSCDTKAIGVTVRRNEMSANERTRNNGFTGEAWRLLFNGLHSSINFPADPKMPRDSALQRNSKRPPPTPLPPLSSASRHFGTPAFRIDAARSFAL